MIRILAFAGVAIFAALLLPVFFILPVVALAALVVFVDRPILRQLGLMVAVFVGFGSIAFAADAVAPVASTVTIPWGDWFGGLLTAAATLFVAVLTRLAAMAPAAVRTFLTNDVIAKAVDYAIATTRDAARGQAVSIPVSNQLIAAALRWVVDNEPKIARWADDKLRPLIVAQLSARGVIPADASSANLAVTAPGAA